MKLLTRFFHADARALVSRWARCRCGSLLAKGGGRVEGRVGFGEVTFDGGALCGVQQGAGTQEQEVHRHHGERRGKWFSSRAGVRPLSVFDRSAVFLRAISVCAESIFSNHSIRLCRLFIIVQNQVLFLGSLCYYCLKIAATPTKSSQTSFAHDFYQHKMIKYH